MKKKSINVLILVIFLIFMIYMKTRDTSVYYLNIGDENIQIDGIGYGTKIVTELENDQKLEKFIEFKYDDYRSTDLLNTIRNNDYIYVDGKKQTIQNALIKADITTIWIGMNDFKYGLLKENNEDIYNYMDTLLIDIEVLLSEVKKYTKEQVFLIGYYTLDSDKKIFSEYLNQKLEKICKKKDIEFIEIESDIKNMDSVVHEKIKVDILEKFTFS